VATIASAVSNIKAQSVNWYTKYRSRWKKCKARVATREKAYTRSRSVNSDVLKKSPLHDKVATATDTTSTTTTTITTSNSATMESIPSLPADSLVANEITDTKNADYKSATGLARDPEVLLLLDKYSSELVAMVKQKLQ